MHQRCTAADDAGHRYVPYFFDWVGATIAATIEILNRAGAPFIEHAGGLELVDGRVRAKNIAGVHIWHINSFLGLPEMQRISSLADYPDGVEKFIHFGLFDPVLEKMGIPVNSVQSQKQ